MTAASPGLMMSDVLELLTAQHLEIEVMFAELVATRPDARGPLVGALADKVTTHLAAEETLFYPEVVGATSAETMQEILAEHEAINTALAELLWIAHTEEVLSQKFVSLGELFEGHMRWQEQSLFAAVAERESPRRGLGAELRALAQSSLCIAA